MRCFLISCSKNEIGNVKVKFTNTTGHKLKKLKIGGKKIGVLKADRQTEYIPFDKFQFDSGTPDEQIEATIDGNNTNDYSGFYRCVTDKYSVDEGTFEMDISLIEIDNEVFLRLEKK